MSFSSAGSGKTLQSVTRGPSFSSAQGGAAKPEFQQSTKQAFNKALGAGNIPAVTPDPLGRYRLLTALSRKFGAGFRSHPDAAQALHHFDREFNYYRTLRKTLGGGGNMNG